MVAENDGEKGASRPPTVDDLVRLCRELNRQGARYLVISGIAMIQAGFVRATEDIDLLIEPSVENEQRVRSALLRLPDQAVRELGADDLRNYLVVRIADEFVVDLMSQACGIEYETASRSVAFVELNGVTIPFASPELMWALKQTGGEKDKLDLLFLKQLLGKRM